MIATCRSRITLPHLLALGVIGVWRTANVFCDMQGCGIKRIFPLEVKTLELIEKLRDG